MMLRSLLFEDYGNISLMLIKLYSCGRDSRLAELSLSASWFNEIISISMYIHIHFTGDTIYVTYCMSMT